MMFEWDAFMLRLQGYSSDVHTILPPCAGEQIEGIESELGELPTTLKAMLQHFNGAELFSGDLLTFFRIANDPPLPPLEWASEWCIDTFTRKWRAAGAGRQDDWAIAMTNYGGLVLLENDDMVKEWDTRVAEWILNDVPFHEWVEKVFREGESIQCKHS